MSAPYCPGRFSRPRLIGSKLTTNRAPRSLHSCGRSPRPLRDGRRNSDAARSRTASGRRACFFSASGSRNPAGAGSVARRPCRVGACRSASVCRYSGCTLSATSTLLRSGLMLQRHEHALGDGAAAFVEAGVGHIQAGQLADQRLVLEERLQAPLARLGLVGRVGGVEFAARRDGIDHGRDEVIVAAAAEEADRAVRRSDCAAPGRQGAAPTPSRSGRAALAAGREIGAIRESSGRVRRPRRRRSLPASHGDQRACSARMTRTLLHTWKSRGLRCG